MKEDYLHFLWRMRYLPSKNLLLTNNQEIEIIDFGEYNANESGPDFLHAKVIIDGILWFGSIEFHLKSSDWLKHGHQHDKAYDNVILHVVWEEDQEILIKERVLPCLLLSTYVKTDFDRMKMTDFSSHKILPCVYSLSEVNELVIEKEKEAVLYAKFMKKIQFIDTSQKDGYSQVLYELLASAFGAKVNKDPFWQLAREIPIKRLLKINQSKRAHIICEASGLDFQSNKEKENRVSTNNMKDWQWKRKGLHPKGFPEIRVNQFANYIQHFDFDFGFLSLSNKELLDYLRASFVLTENGKPLKGNSVTYSKNFQDLIIINSFVPFLFWLGEKRGIVSYQNQAFQLLQAIPAEKNHITKFLVNCGFKIESAYDSQSLLELYNQRCTRKKCLTCAIGIDILK